MLGAHRLTFRHFYLNFPVWGSLPFQNGNYLLSGSSREAFNVDNPTLPTGVVIVDNWHPMPNNDSLDYLTSKKRPIDEKRRKRSIGT